MKQQFWHTKKNLWILAICLQLLLSSACDGNSQVAAGKIAAAEAFSLFPSFKMDSLTNTWRIASYDSQYARLYYYEDWSLFRVPYVETSLSYHNDDLINDTGETTKYFTIIASRHSDSVYRYDSANFKDGKLIGNKDSVLAHLPVISFNVDSVMKTSNPVLLSSKRKGGVLDEEYLITLLDDTTQKGKMLLSFSDNELKDMPFSWGWDLEAKKKMRISKIMTIVDARYAEACKCYMEKMELPNTLTEIKLSRKEEDDLRNIFKEAAAILN